MTKQKHTPLPWAVKGLNEDDPRIVSIKENIRIASLNFYHFAKPDENAAFIVRACNSHYKLVEALEELLSWTESVEGNGVSCGMVNTPDSIFTDAQAALKEARGE